jgi:hypothetical protein
MYTPQFKSGNVGLMNSRQIPVYEVRRAQRYSIAGLYFSEMLLMVGIILIFLNNLNILAPGSYFGAFNWVTATVFSFGLVINFLSIPFLYFSSFNNFKVENDYWDKELFWILPLFFFGTFYLYESQISSAMAFLTISIILIIAVHFRFFFASKKLLPSSNVLSKDHYQQYYVSLNYLLAYYLVLFALILAFDPLRQVFAWVRFHF